MTQPPTVQVPAFGACLRDKNTWLMTAGDEVCIYCGQPPVAVLPFPDSAGAQASGLGPPAEAPASAEEPVLIPATCPYCDLTVHVSVTEKEVVLLPVVSGQPAAETGDAPADLAPPVSPPAVEAGVLRTPGAEEPPPTDVGSEIPVSTPGGAAAEDPLPAAAEQHGD